MPPPIAPIPPLGLSPKATARLAGIFYFATILAGSASLVTRRGQVYTNLAADLSYVVVVALLYVVFRAGAPRLTLLATLFGLAGCVVGILNILGRPMFSIHPLAVFGVYCVLLGVVIARSGLLPRVVGQMVSVGGLGWLTFGLPSLRQALFPYNMAPGIIAETILALYLVIVGVRAGSARRSRSLASGA